jgi:hypothetical protein
MKMAEHRSGSWNMTIYRADGHRIEAALLARYQHAVRVAVRDGDDAVEFKDWNGTWISEDCEPVRIEFDWEERTSEPSSPEWALLCSPERARLVIGVLRRDRIIADFPTVSTHQRVC